MSSSLLPVSPEVFFSRYEALDHTTVEQLTPEAAMALVPAGDEFYNHYWAPMVRLCEDAGYRVTTDLAQVPEALQRRVKPSMAGATNPGLKIIWIRRNMSPNAQLATLFHEYAHTQDHELDWLFGFDQLFGTSYGFVTSEVFAELVSFLIQQAIGLHSTYSETYLKFKFGDEAHVQELRDIMEAQADRAAHLAAQVCDVLMPQAQAA